MKHAPKESALPLASPSPSLLLSLLPLARPVSLLLLEEGLVLDMHFASLIFWFTIVLHGIVSTSTCTTITTIPTVREWLILDVHFVSPIFWFAIILIFLLVIGIVTAVITTSSKTVSQNLLYICTGECISSSWFQTRLFYTIWMLIIVRVARQICIYVFNGLPSL